MSAGLLATFMMALLQRIIPTILIELAVKVGSGSPQSWSQWLYSRTFGGLTKLGAVIVFVTGAAASAAWFRQGRSLQSRIIDPRRHRQPAAQLAVHLHRHLDFIRLR